MSSSDFGVSDPILYRILKGVAERHNITTAECVRIYKLQYDVMADGIRCPNLPQVYLPWCGMFRASKKQVKNRIDTYITTQRIKGLSLNERLHLDQYERAYTRIENIAIRRKEKKAIRLQNKFNYNESGVSEEGNP